MWICKNCDTKNEDNNLYCSCCGEKRKETVRVEQNSSTQSTNYTANTGSTATQGTVQNQTITNAGRETQQNKETPERVKQRRNARILAFAIAILFVVLDIWSAAIENTVLDSAYLKNRIMFAIVPFICCGVLFFGNSFVLVGIASFILGFFALYDVFGFAFYSILTIKGETFPDLVMGILIIVGIIIGIWAGKTVYMGFDEKKMKLPKE